MSTAAFHYWRAYPHSLALRRAFEAARERGDRSAMRASFYHLAYFHARTRAILRSAIDDHHEALARTALQNLLVLHAELREMHRAATDVVPGTAGHLREARLHLVDDLLIELLEEAVGRVPADTLIRRVAGTDALAGVPDSLIRLHLDQLVTGGYAASASDGYERTSLPYSAENLDELELRALVSLPFARRLADAGFYRLGDVTDRRAGFRTCFCDLTGFADDTAALFAAAAELLEERELIDSLSPWRHADLLHSSYPRPYQLELYTILRGYGYRGQVIEAPAGSGKTLVGMLCIQDWLRTLARGETVLVLVPTVNYLQQWQTELCSNEPGLQLAPGQVHTGRPDELTAARSQAGTPPCVLVSTYAALARAGSGTGKGGFDRDSIETFLQGNNVQYVILDEVHKLAENLHSVSADVARVLLDWLADGSLRGVIGFSGTAAVFRERLQALRLNLATVIGIDDLIPQGFVSPFAEFGLPYAYAERERRIHDLLDQYKSQLKTFLDLVGGTTLRRLYTAIPLSERHRLARDLLGMYSRRPDREAAIADRLTAWESGATVRLSELPLVLLVQIAHGWSDEELVCAAIAESPDGENDGEQARRRFADLLERLTSIREELRPLVRHAELERRLDAPGFGRSIDATALRGLAGDGRAARTRTAQARRVLATTLAGLYTGLRSWYPWAGEGRVDGIRAIISAEKAVRPVRGIVVFDAAQRLARQSAVARAGYRGIAGTFVELLDAPEITPIAVLSSEIYLPRDDADPAAARIAQYIRQVIMAGELSTSLLGIIVDGLEPTEPERNALLRSIAAVVTSYAAKLEGLRAARPAEFSHRVLAPLRRAVRRVLCPSVQRVALARLDRGHHRLDSWIQTFFEYALLAAAFSRAEAVTIERADGRRWTASVISMPTGGRKQLAYDLTARLIDAKQLPFNLAIVSGWARTGWNVVTPDVLIDATATRDPVAWQQLRGRAMRTMPGWSDSCRQLAALLLNPPAPASTAGDSGEQLRPDSPLDGAGKALLREALHYLRSLHAGGGAENDKYGALRRSIERGDLTAVSGATRLALGTALVLARNKVTHIYELVPASGAAAQVRWDRVTRGWRRTDALEAKHRREFAVCPLSGRLLAGPSHAPLIYADDPRRDVPAELQRRLVEVLSDCDPQIVAGWLAPPLVCSAAISSLE